MTHAEYLANLTHLRRQHRLKMARDRSKKIDDPSCTAVRDQLRADIKAWKKQKGTK